jgi:hypothetical protein
MDISAIEEAVKSNLQKTGGDVTVKVFSAKLEFRVDNGPRIPACGGFVGGEHIGILRKGKMYPEMITGVDLLGAGKWFDLLQPLGWFE